MLSSDEGNQMECPVAPGEVLDAKYRVDRVIASGGMGVVVEACHLALDQKVAIKFLRAGGVDADAAAARLRREARVAARIRSQHAARVFDVGLLRGTVPYMVMEYLEGNDLADELAMRTRLPVEEAVHYALQAIEALAEAHAAGIVHRDVKPENIFLALRTDGTRTVKLLDFGISKWSTPASLSDFALNQSAILGSPPYMSPEQLRAADSVDPRADVWSLGTILYEAVTGQLAFSGASLPEICAAVFETPPRRLREHDPELPEAFDRAVLRCLAKDPDRRYSTVADLAQAIAPFAPHARVYADRARRVVAGVPLSGRPTPVPSDASYTLFVQPGEIPEPPTLRADAAARALETVPPLRALRPTRTRSLAIVLAALGGTVFGIAAWTVSSARGALEAETALGAPQGLEPGDSSVASERTVDTPPRTPVKVAPGVTAPHSAAPPRPAVSSSAKAQSDARRRTRPRASLALGSASATPGSSETAPQPSGLTDFGGRR